MAENGGRDFTRKELRHTCCISFEFQILSLEGQRFIRLGNNGNKDFFGADSSSSSIEGGMADSTCVVRGFSYPAGIPNESKQGNLMLALGDSVSFGRFLNESLSWEKRSTFLHKNYVEEAEQYSQPGSVAQKKAFFEAHYKRIAAKKAAEALEQETAVNTEAGEVVIGNDADDGQRHVLNANPDVHAVEMNTVKLPYVREGDFAGSNECSFITAVGTVAYKENAVIPGETVSASEGSETLKIERPSPKPDSVAAASELIPSATSKNRSNLPLLVASIQHNIRNDPSAPAKQVSDLEKQSSGAQGTMKSSMDSRDVKDSPSKSAQSNTSSTNPAATLQSKTTRMKAPLISSTLGNKSTNHKWHFFSALFSTSMTENSAAKGKQKLEEKFNASESQKLQPGKSLKDKAGSKVRKLSCIFCFKHSPSHDQRGILENQGTTSMPSPPPTHSTKAS